MSRLTAFSKLPLSSQLFASSRPQLRSQQECPNRPASLSPHTGSATFPCTQDTFEYGAAVSKGTTKAAQDWTLEDTTAPENAPTNAFMEGDAAHSGCGCFWFCKLVQCTRAIPTPNASLSPQPGRSTITPGGLERAERVQQQTDICLAQKQSGIPLCAAQTICPHAVKQCSQHTPSQTAQSCPGGSSCPHSLHWKM